MIKNEDGQAITEYILMMAIIVVFYVMAATAIDRMGLAQKLAAPITGAFAMTYQYGDPRAKGYGEDDGPKFHPRIRPEDGEGNFRIFFNAKK